MGYGEPHPLRRKGEPADGGRYFEASRLALARKHEGLPAGRPCDIGGWANRRPERDMIDPAPLGVGGDDLMGAVVPRGDDVAVIAAGEDTRAVTRCREDGAAMHHDALGFAALRREQERFLAQ